MSTSNATIIFANQKGGVGKSMLCTFLALYLTSEKECAVSVIDADPQRTITKRREEEQKFTNKDTSPYRISPVIFTDDEKTETLFRQIQTLKEIILIDTPGSIDYGGIATILTMCDYLVVPFNYEKAVMLSTLDFLEYVDDLNARLGQKGPKKIFIPNRLKKSWGTAAEKEQFAKIEEYLRELGHVCPPIYDLAELNRGTTSHLGKFQLERLEDTFGSIWDFLAYD